MGFAITDLGTDIKIVYTDPASKTTSWTVNKTDLSIIKYVESMDRFKLVVGNELIFFSFGEVTSPVAVDGAALYAALTAMRVTTVTQSQTFTVTDPLGQTVFTTTFVVTSVAANLFLIVGGAMYPSTDPAVDATKTGANEVTTGVTMPQGTTITIISLS